jgi:hypothetical protein
MSYRIDYYSDGNKVADLYVAPVIEHAVTVARNGLAAYNARYAEIVDVTKTGKIVELIHRDVRP